MKRFTLRIKPTDDDQERRREVDQIRGAKTYDVYSFVDLNGEKSNALFVEVYF